MNFILGTTTPQNGLHTEAGNVKVLLLLEDIAYLRLYNEFSTHEPALEFL